MDWDSLHQEAVAVAANAYAPYSEFTVGAAGLTDRGHLVTGCNVENASYGITLCAECGLVSDLRRQGGGRLVAVCIVDGHGGHLAPCGRCRQLLYEHGGPSLLIHTDDDTLQLEELLPDPFGPGHLRGLGDGG
ncbi:MAG: cytidine deaminase [Actinomycetia bacterium]|nr:cytidine deaminase [Actinomycetes bacterium]